MIYIVTARESGTVMAGERGHPVMSEDPDDPAVDPAPGDDAPDAAGSSPWGRTIQEANAMAADLRKDGREVVVVRAGHTAPVAPDEGETDRFGLVYVAPDGVAETLPAAIDDADLANYEVFRRAVGSDLFLVTRLTDPDARVAVLLVGGVDRTAADGLVAAARERGALHSHVELLDGTHLLSVRHDDPSAFFPDIE
jgi:hypothetical protein